MLIARYMRICSAVKLPRKINLHLSLVHMNSQYFDIQLQFACCFSVIFQSPHQTPFINVASGAGTHLHMNTHMVTNYLKFFFPCSCFVFVRDRCKWNDRNSLSSITCLVCLYRHIIYMNEYADNSHVFAINCILQTATAACKLNVRLPRCNVMTLIFTSSEIVIGNGNCILCSKTFHFCSNRIMISGFAKQHILTHPMQITYHVPWLVDRNFYFYFYIDASSVCFFFTITVDQYHFKIAHK